MADDIVLSRPPIISSSNRIPSRAFTVPDEVEDSPWDQDSREGSIQIIESHPRTFSVPSTDDEESESESDDRDSLEIASSVQGELEKDSAATTPEHRMSHCLGFKLKDSNNSTIASQVRGLNLKGPSLPDILKPAKAGTSNQDPIDLEGDASKRQDVPDSESEDEGPEILPTHQSSLKHKALTQENEHQPSRQHYRTPTVTDEEADEKIKDQARPVVAETQAHDLTNKGKAIEQEQSPEVSGESVNGSTDGFDSTDEDGFDIDDGFSDSSHQEDARKSISKLFQPDQASKLPSEAEKRSVNPLESQESDIKSNRFNVNVSKPVNVSQPQLLNPGPPIPRAPSPSDAALMKKPSDVDSRPRQQMYQGYRQAGTGLFPHPSRRDAITNAHDPLAPSNYIYGPNAYPTYQSVDTHNKPYAQGPFSTYGQTSAPYQSTPWYWNGSRSSKQNFQYLQDWETPAEVDYPDLGQNAPIAATYQAAEDALPSGVFTPPYKAAESSDTEPRRASEAQASKIDIASLVNESHVDEVRPPKRKAAEMSSTDEVEVGLMAQPIMKALEMDSSRLVTTHFPNDLGNEHEVQLPDAPARDVISPAQETLLSQDATSAPVFDSPSQSITVKGSDIEEPPRKKARTSASSPSRGVGKFVSGVCVGLVGAFAAFIATIPASVREEALRELSNAA